MCMILNSDWINEEVQKWLVRELYESPNVYLEQGENLTCPARTICLFAHTEDLDYSALP